MTENKLEQNTHRRGFLGILASGAAALGLTALASPLALAQQKGAAKPAAPQGKTGAPPAPKNEADMWFDKVKGKHRVIYDATRWRDVLPLVWPKVFLMTNEKTGTPEADCGVVVVFRHDGIPYAFQDRMWEKYNFAEVFEATDVSPMYQAADAKTATKSRNPFWNTKHGDFAVPGIGVVDIGIKDLQASGVMFCVCNAAMTVFSAVVAEKMGKKPEEVYNDWKANLIPGIQIVPSGVWAVGRAQEHGCKYIFAG
jgi:intracellular sulfur oxidation DsrE/DsrF family protein